MPARSWCGCRCPSCSSGWRRRRPVSGGGTARRGSAARWRWPRPRSAGNVGDIAFDAGPTLVGSHSLTCKRPGVGSFVGTVEITAKGSDYLLTFLLGHSVLYKGVGILSGDGRLIVGWSFGSSPSLAVYHYNAEGLLSGRRVTLRSNGQVSSTNERMAREGEVAARLLPVAAHGDLEATGRGGSAAGGVRHADRPCSGRARTQPAAGQTDDLRPAPERPGLTAGRNAGSPGSSARRNAPTSPAPASTSPTPGTGQGQGRNSRTSQKTIGELIESGTPAAQAGKSSSDKPARKRRAGKYGAAFFSGRALCSGGRRLGVHHGRRNPPPARVARRTPR